MGGAGEERRCPCPGRKVGWQLHRGSLCSHLFYILKVRRKGKSPQMLVLMGKTSETCRVTEARHTGDPVVVAALPEMPGVGRQPEGASVDWGCAGGTGSDPGQAMGILLG